MSESENPDVEIIYEEEIIEKEVVEEEEEIIDESSGDDDDDDDDENDKVSPTTISPSRFPTFQDVCFNFDAYAVSERFKLHLDDLVHISIPTSCLSVLFQRNFGFEEEPILLNLDFSHTNIDWEQKPPILSFSHPKYGEIFNGSIFIKKSIDLFFSPNFQPRKKYISTLAVLSIYSDFKEDLVYQIQAKNFNIVLFQNLLGYCCNEVVEAQCLLINGWPYFEPTIPYEKCPLIYLILEILDAFYLLKYHCVICGNDLKKIVDQPTICEADLNASFTALL